MINNFGVMSAKYKIIKQDDAFVISLTVVGWIDDFIRINQKLLLNFEKILYSHYRNLFL